MVTLHTAGFTEQFVQGTSEIQRGKVPAQQDDAFAFACAAIEILQALYRRAFSKALHRSGTRRFLSLKVSDGELEMAVFYAQFRCGQGSSARLTAVI